jgi:SAM-dependent methyltransferase
MTDLAAHWENVYATKDPAAVSWYRPHLERSLAFVEAAGLAPGAHVLDVGGGASTLVDDLVARGLSVTVLDLSPSALARSRARLGPRAETVRFVAADVLTSGISQGSVDLWHDRAVLHFLRDDADRARYRARLLDALAPRGHVVLGGFAPDGPEKCSGLPVCRASADDLIAFLGEPFEELGRAAEVHVTPWSSTQSFAYVHARRRGA